MAQNTPVKGKFPNGLADAMHKYDIGPTPLATLVETSKQNISRWRDQSQKLPLHWAVKLAPVLKTTVEALMVPSSSRQPLIKSFDPDAPWDNDQEPRMVEGEFGRDVGDIPAGAILQIDVSLGLGGGGATNVTSLMHSSGNSYAAEGVKDWMRLPDEIVRGRFRVPVNRIRCFDSAGDSMVPTVNDGDIVFVDVGHKVPSPPGIYALADAMGGVILKRLEIISQIGEEPVRVMVISDNPRHPPKERTLDEISITGRYLGRLTTA